MNRILLDLRTAPARFIVVPWLLLGYWAFVVSDNAQAGAAAPAMLFQAGDRQVGPYSARTLAAALTVDRDSARLLAFTLKPRPYHRILAEPEPSPIQPGRPAQLEIRLLGPGRWQHTRRFEINGLCLEHPLETEPHVDGDFIQTHGHSIPVELPELPGCNRIEIAYYRSGANGLERKLLATESLESGRFVSAGERFRYSDLVFSEAPAAPNIEASDSLFGNVYWPETYDDPDLYRVYGNPDEISQRINVVIVPDGYTYEEKALMESHADAFVEECRARTPLKEHDLFLNYILVYAYSAESGTDECDCGIIKDTAMGTRFLDHGFACGDSGNRTLTYSGRACDTDVSYIAAAEVRAPAQDTTIVMVNTTRWGGSGGGRAVYAAGHPLGPLIALHELGHSFAGLADEYVSYPGCGTEAGEINTSKNPTTGAWPEWIEDLGPPIEGAQYYEQCVFRPTSDCTMRASTEPFCEVCTQRWALLILGHSRVSPTAPIQASSPSATVTASVGQEVDFSVTTRLPTDVVNVITWRLQAPGGAAPETVAIGVESFRALFPAAGVYTLTCEVIADADLIKPAKTGANRAEARWEITVSPGQATIQQRSIFYNNSAFDGNDPGSNASDDAAIAPDKVALLPGNAATFANYTSYSRGINGITVDLLGLPGTPTIADFAFRVGNDNRPQGWTTAQPPASITVRTGAGLAGSDRITLIWPDNAIEKTWLQVTVKATANTGLAADDVFYFGNAIGETGNSTIDAQVNSTDVNAARMNPRFSINPADIENAYDFNRDKLVNSTDVNLARLHTSFSVNALRLIDPEEP